MAMMMEMPVVPTTKPAAPPNNGEKAVQGKEEDFREVLNEENLKQAKGSAGKDPVEKSSAEKPSEESTEDSPLTAELVAAGSAVIPPTFPPDTTETSVEGDASAPPVTPEGEKPVAAVIAAPAVKPTPEPEVETDQKGIQEQQPQTPLNSEKKAVLEDGSKVPRDSGANPPALNEEILPEKPAVSVIAVSAAQQPNQLQPNTGQDIRKDSNPGPQGLMEASFAGLLKPVDPGHPAARRNPASAAQAEISGVQVAGEEADPLLSAAPETVIDETGSDLAEALLNKTAGSSVSETDGPLTNHRSETPLFDNALASAAQGKPETTGNAGPLPVGAQMPPVAASPNEEVRVLDQVLNQLPLNRMGEKNRVVIRLHPEELGEVKLDLVMDKDHLKAQLVTQNQQVQGILEKHLPRLQEALQNQGINLDQVEVSVDSGGHQGREFFDRHNQPSHRVHSFGPHQATSEPLNLAASGNQPVVNRGGLSLRI